MERISKLTMVLSAGVRSFCVLFFFLAACSMDRKEIARISSPDHRVEAVIVNESGGGAAGSSEYYIYMAENTNPEKLGDSVFTASNCAGIHGVWLDNNTLQIAYHSGCSIRGFKNKWYSAKADRQFRRFDVEIVLAKAQETAEERRWTNPK